MEGPSVSGILYFSKIIFNIRFSFDGLTVSSTVGSNCEHDSTSLGSIKNVQVAVGSYMTNKKDVVF